jgi:hypothetical protein
MSHSLVSRYPCPCCGYLVFREVAGSWSICPICQWEDDLTQLRWPSLEAGANNVTLVEAQQNYRQFKISELALGHRGRPPKEHEALDEGWRPIDLRIDNFEDPGAQDAPWPEDRTVLYWWRPTFWRR